MAITTSRSLEPTSLEANEPGEIMMVDLVGPFPQSEPYTQVLTAMDVFSRCLFTTPLTKVDAETVARALLHILTTHSYIPSKIISDEGTVLVSRTFMEKMTELQIKIEHATVKHPQAIGALERCHASLKRFRHSQTGKKRFKPANETIHCDICIQYHLPYNDRNYTDTGLPPEGALRSLGIRFSGVLRTAHMKLLDTQEG